MKINHLFSFLVIFQLVIAQPVPDSIDPVVLEKKDTAQKQEVKPHSIDPIPSDGSQPSQGQNLKQAPQTIQKKEPIPVQVDPTPVQSNEQNLQQEQKIVNDVSPKEEQIAEQKKVEIQKQENNEIKKQEEVKVNGENVESQEEKQRKQKQRRQELKRKRQELQRKRQEEEKRKENELQQQKLKEEENKRQEQQNRKEKEEEEQKQKEEQQRKREQQDLKKQEEMRRDRERIIQKQKGEQIRRKSREEEIKAERQRKEQQKTETEQQRRERSEKYKAEQQRIKDIKRRQQEAQEKLAKQRNEAGVDSNAGFDEDGSQDQTSKKKKQESQARRLVKKNIRAIYKSLEYTQFLFQLNNQMAEFVFTPAAEEQITFDIRVFTHQDNTYSEIKDINSDTPVKIYIYENNQRIITQNQFYFSGMITITAKPNTHYMIRFYNSGSQKLIEAKHSHMLTSNKVKDLLDSNILKKHGLHAKGLLEEMTAIFKRRQLQWIMEIDNTTEFNQKMKKYYFFEIFEMLVTIMICFGQIKLIKQALSKTSII